MSAAVKPKRCKAPSCRQSFVPFRPMQDVCSGACALELVRVKRAKEVEREARRDKKERRQRLEQLKTMNKICDEAQRAVNLYVRIRDFGKGCISCEPGKVEHAGHFFPIGSKFRNNRLRFDTRAIHGQCTQCNHSAGGNIHGYIAGLERRYGRQYVEMLYDLKGMAERGELPRLTREEVAAIKASHWKMGRELGRASNAAACA